MFPTVDLSVSERMSTFGLIASGELLGIDSLVGGGSDKDSRFSTFSGDTLLFVSSRNLLAS